MVIKAGSRAFCGAGFIDDIFLRPLLNGPLDNNSREFCDKASCRLEKVLLYNVPLYKIWHRIKVVHENICT